MTEKVSVNYLTIVVVLCTLIIYWMTTGTSLTSGDAGELAAAQYVWGIAHAPGYPIYIFIGYAWSKLLVGFSPLAALNLLSGVYCALACTIIFVTVFRILESIYENNRTINLTIALASALAIGFSETFWSQAVGVEVYGLHLTILTLSIFFAVKLMISNNQNNWLWIGLVIGMGFVHHLTIVLLGPALIFVLYTHSKSGILSLSKLGKGIGLGLAVILFSWMLLMFRSSMDPELDCGNPETLKNLIFHITGSPYQGYTFQSVDEAIYNLRYITKQLLSELSLFGLLVGMIGAWHLYIRSKILGAFFIISFLTNIVIAINYGITDINAYFLLSYICLGIFIAIGLRAMLDLFISKVHQNKVSKLVFALPLFLVTVNFSGNNFKEYSDIEKYYEKAIESLPNDAVLFTMDFETDISASYYYQLVEGRRRDITIVDMISITNYDWFGNHLLKNDTTFFGPCVTEYRMLCDLDFEKESEGFKAQHISTEMFKCLFERHIGSRPVYMSHWTYSDYFKPGGPIDILERYSVVPQEYFYKIVEEKKYYGFEGIPDYTLINPKLADSYTEEIELVNRRRSFVLRENKYISDFIRHRQARMLDHRLQYEMKWDSIDIARQMYKDLLLNFPKYKLPDQIERQLLE